MNPKTIAIAAVLMAAAIAGISATTTFAYAQYDDCDYSIESRTTVCEGNGMETTYGAAPDNGETMADETSDSSLLADDPTAAIGSTTEDADDAEDDAEDNAEDNAEDAADEEKDAADDAEDDADEAED
jgi:hypothetical protein